MDDLHIPVSRRYAPQAAQPYWNMWRVLALLGILISLPTLLAVSCLVASHQALRTSEAQLARTTLEENAALMSIERAPETYAAPLKTPYYFSEHIAGKTVKECSAQTGGVINEEWQRCRHGYEIQRKGWR